MRLLAHGGPARAERARLGSWPEIPSGLLLDGRGIAPGAPAFGLGMLQGRPFLIHRQLNGEGREAAVYSLLLEPRPEDFARFHWNAAWLLASLLADGPTRRLLLEEPEFATEETLAERLERCTPLRLVKARAPEAVAGLLARAILEPGPFAATLPELGSRARRNCIGFAAALKGLPVALRTGRGWLVGGVESHAEILGCAVLLGGTPAPPADPGPGLAALARLERLADSNAEVAELLAMPWPNWGSRGLGLIHSLKILGLLETRTAQAWEALGSVPAREGPLAKEIRSAALRTIDDSSAALGFEPTTVLLEEAEAGRRRLAGATVERLDRGALLRHFSTHGIPPAPWPMWIEIPPELKAELWTRLLGSARSGWAALAARALEDLAPDHGRSDAGLGVILAAIQAAREQGGCALEWASFAALPAYPELSPLLANWARDNVPRMRGEWQTAYLALGDDPGGRVLARAHIPAPVAGRLVRAIAAALRGPYGERAGAWLDSLATSPLRDLVPLVVKLELAAAAGGRWAALERLRQAYEGEPGGGEAVPSDERPFLRRELEGLAQRAPAGTPDVSALCGQLGGELPERTLRAVTKWARPLRPAEPRARPGWLSAVVARLGMGKPRREARPAQRALQEEAGRPMTPSEAVCPEPEARDTSAAGAPVGPDAPRPCRPAPTEAHTRAAAPPPSSTPPTPSTCETVSIAAPGANPSRSRAPVSDGTTEPAGEPEQPAIADQASTGLEDRLRQWVLGGDPEDDRRAGEEMIRFFEQGSPHDLTAARTVLEGFSAGVLYRLAARAALNPRLLDGLARAVDSPTLDRIVSDAAHYDLSGFARQAAERLRRDRSEGSSRVDEAILRLLHDGPRHLRDGLARELRAGDGARLAERVRPDG